MTFMCNLLSCNEIPNFNLHLQKKDKPFLILELIDHYLMIMCHIYAN